MCKSKSCYDSDMQKTGMTVGCLVVGFLLINVPYALADPAGGSDSTIKCLPTDKFCALAPIPGLTDKNSTDVIFTKGAFNAFFNNLYIFMIGASVILAIIMI